MIEHVVDFKATDGITLYGILRTRETSASRLLIQVHGMTSNCFGDRNKIIAEAVADLGIDALSFNNRGSDIARFVQYPDGTQKITGTAFEDIGESYYDICGAVQYAVSCGYDEVFLQGHSLGSTKVVYAYNRMLKENKELAKVIKAIILLSMVDVVNVVKQIPKKYIHSAELALHSGYETYMLYKEEYISPMSPQTFLRYAKHNQDINFAQFGNEKEELEVLNSFEVPLFFRWGNVNEIALMDVSKQVEFVKQKIHNPHLDAGIIDGGNHSYVGKEHELANEIASFLSKICCS